MTTLEDAELVRDLQARYSLAVDGQHHRDWAETFTPDGVFASPRFGSYEGRAILEKFCSDYHTSLDGIQPRHVISNIQMDLGENEGTGSVYLSYYHTKDGKTELSGLGGYKDTLHKIDGQWYFARRDVFLDE